MRSPEDILYEDGEPIGPEYIFGNTATAPDDLIPSGRRPVRHRPYRKVKTNAQIREFSRRILKATNKSSKNPLPFASPAPSLSPAPAPEPEAPADPNDWASHTYTEIPDDEVPRRHPVFGINPDIVFDEDYSPERDAESRLPVENLVSYEKEDIDRVESKAAEATADIQKRLLEEGAALLMSYDDASSFAEAVLRDGLGISVEIDSSVSEAISHMMRLNMIAAYMDKMSLPQAIKTRYLRVLTEKIAEDTHTSIQKKNTSEKYNAVLKNLQARMKSSPDNATADLASQLGVVKHRSNKGGGGSAVDDQHAFNDAQNAGVRFEGP